MQLKEFLQNVVTASEPGYFCLAVANGSGWLDQWHKYPDDLDKIVARAHEQAKHANVYFSSYLFKAPQAIRENVLPTRTIQADLDDADLATLPREPSILIETSPGRHQAYWILETGVSLDEHETLSRKVTYSIPLCDRSGWALGRKVRVPETFNYKYLSGPKPVKIVAASLKKYEPEQFETLPEVPGFLLEHFDPDFLENPVGVDTHPSELLDQIKDVIPVRIYVQYDIQQDDRSEALWGLLCWAFKAGLSRQQVFTLAKGSANNKFSELRHRADQELAKDILRAQHAVNANIQDAKQVISDLYKNQLGQRERMRQIQNVVLAEMKAQGEFMHTYAGTLWYIRRDIGKPLPVSPGSGMLQTLLDIQFGLNSIEQETKFVIHGLRAYTETMPDTAVQSALAYYDKNAQHLLLHTGKRDVLRIQADSIEHMVDGAYNIIFPWGVSVEAFTPVLGASNIDWGDELFGNGTRGFGSSVENLINMTPAQAKALLKVWLIFVLFRNAASSRPIIATLGQPGSGKSTLFRKIYALIYGKYKSLGAVTTMEDFDIAVSTSPLHVLDNVDTWEKWLPDRLALSAATSDVDRRKLFTDADVFTLRRQAVIGVTAHNPKFGREDVADRFLLFSYQRLSTFISEELILGDILRKRNLIWGAIVRDVQKILATPIPTSNIPQFRIEDFARLGLWIARAIGVEEDFRSSIEDVKSSQQNFTLEEDGMLVSAVTKLVEHTSVENSNKFYTAAQLWSLLENCSDDARTFGHLYKSSVGLGKKLLAMQDSLKRVVDITQKPVPGGGRTWQLKRKA